METRSAKTCRNFRGTFGEKAMGAQQDMGIRKVEAETNIFHHTHCFFGQKANKLNLLPAKQFCHV